MTRQRDHDRRRLAQGWRRVDVWLDPETLASLQELTADGTTAQEAVRAAINAQAASAGEK